MKTEIVCLCFTSFEHLPGYSYASHRVYVNKYAIYAYTHGPVTGSGPRAVRLPIG